MKPIRLPAMAEAALLLHVKMIARLFNWTAYHTHDSRRSDKGFPDICCVRGERIIFAELKTARGKLSTEQECWLDRLQLTGKCEIYIWRPADLYSGLIDRILR